MFGPKSSDWLARVQHEFVVVFSQTLKGVLAKGGVDELVAKLQEEMTSARQPYSLVIRAWGQKP